MKMEFKVLSASGDLVKLMDSNGLIIELPKHYFNHDLIVDEVVFINFNDTKESNQAREILQEIFKTN